jgi:WD40 repeat protein
MGTAELHRIRLQPLVLVAQRHVAAFLPVLLGLSLCTSLAAQTGKHLNYDDDVKPIFARYCFACHNASEMRSGLNLEAYAGVLKGGGSGDAVIAGRAASSLLYKAVAREEGAPQMPLGNAKIPDAAIATIRDWIAGGLLENAASQPKGPVAPSLDFKPTALNKPEGPPAMPQSLPPFTLDEPARAHPVTAMAASPWAPLVAVAGHERIYLYNLDQRGPAGELAFPEGIPYALRFSRDGSTLLAAGGRGVQSGKVVLFDVITGKRLGVFGDEKDIVLAADLSADGKLVALGGPAKIVKVFAVADGKELYQIKKHTDWITSIEFSPDGALLATGDRSGGIFLWQASSGGSVGNLADHKDSITSLSWRGDSRLLASGSEDGQIIIWNAADGFPVATIAKAHTPKPGPQAYGTPPGGVLSVQFTSDGRLVSVGRDSTVRIWGVDGKPKGASPAADALLTKVAASPDGKLTIAGDYQGRLMVCSGADKLACAPGRLHP